MKAGPIRAHCRHRGGFSLLEIVLALAIIAVAMSLLAQLVGVANRSAAAARDQTKAQLVAESIMAEFAAGVMLPSDTAAEWELDPMWSYTAVVSPEVAANVSAITVTATHNVDAIRPASFSMTQWLFIAPEPAEDTESSTSSTSSATGGA